MLDRICGWSKLVTICSSPQDYFQVFCFSLFSARLFFFSISRFLRHVLRKRNLERDLQTVNTLINFGMAPCQGEPNGVLHGQHVRDHQSRATQLRGVRSVKSMGNLVYQLSETVLKNCPLMSDTRHNSDSVKCKLSALRDPVKAMARILSVSYDEALLHTRRLLLEARGYRVTSAFGLKESLFHCKRGGFDLFILSHSIPKADKELLISEFRASCLAPIVSLCLVSEPKADGADYHIEPDPRELLELIAKILGVAKARSA